MPVPTAYTWTVGELVTAGKMNAYLRDAVAFLLARPGAILGRSGNQTFTTGVPAAVGWNLEIFDDDNAHSTVTNPSRYTVQTAGRWSFTSAFGWTANAAGQRALTFRVNGGGDIDGVNIAAGAAIQQVLNGSMMIALNVGDYVEVFGNQTSGGNLNLDAALHSGPLLECIWERT